MTYSVIEGDSETVVVSVISDDVTLDRDVIVTVITADGTATAASGIHIHMYMYNFVHPCTAFICTLHTFSPFYDCFFFQYFYFHMLVCYTHFSM